MTAAAPPAAGRAAAMAPVTMDDVVALRAGECGCLTRVRHSPRAVLDSTPDDVRGSFFIALLSLVADSRGVFSFGAKPESAPALRILASCAEDRRSHAGAQLRTTLAAAGAGFLRRLRLDRHLVSAKPDVADAALQFLLVVLTALRLEPRHVLSDPATITRVTEIYSALPPPLQADAVAYPHRLVAADAGDRPLRLHHGGDAPPQQPAWLRLPQRLQQPLLATNPLWDGTRFVPLGPPSSVGSVRLPSAVTFFAKHFGLGCVPTTVHHSDAVRHLTDKNLLAKADDPSAQPPPPRVSVNSAAAAGSPPRSVVSAPASMASSPQGAAADGAAAPPTTTAAAASTSLHPPRLTGATLPRPSLVRLYLRDPQNVIFGVMLNQPGTSTTLSRSGSSSKLLSAAGPGDGNVATPAAPAALGHVKLDSPAWLPVPVPSLRITNRSGVTMPLILAHADCGYLFTIALDVEGDLYVSGISTQGQLGTPSAGEPPSAVGAAIADNSSTGGGAVAGTSRFVLLKGLRQKDQIVSISCGPNYVVAVTHTEEMYLWGANDAGTCSVGSASGGPRVVPLPRRVALRRMQVDHVACGSDFVVVLTTDGAVLTWGSLRRLGIGPEEHAMDIIPADKRFLVGGGDTAAATAPGHGHSDQSIRAAAPTTTAIVEGWGPAASAYTSASSWFTTLPCRIPTLDNTARIVAVAAGQQHALLLAGDGSVLSWGYADYCGHTPEYLEQFPTGTTSPMSAGARPFSSKAQTLRSSLPGCSTGLHIWAPTPIDFASAVRLAVRRATSDEDFTGAVDASPSSSSSMTGATTEKQRGLPTSESATTRKGTRAGGGLRTNASSSRSIGGGAACCFPAQIIACGSFHSAVACNTPFPMLTRPPRPALPRSHSRGSDWTNSRSGSDVDDISSGSIGGDATRDATPGVTVVPLEPALSFGPLPPIVFAFGDNTFAQCGGGHCGDSGPSSSSSAFDTSPSMSHGSGKPGSFELVRQWWMLDPKLSGHMSAMSSQAESGETRPRSGSNAAVCAGAFSRTCLQATIVHIPGVTMPLSQIRECLDEEERRFPRHPSRKSRSSATKAAGASSRRERASGDATTDAPPLGEVAQHLTYGDSSTPPPPFSRRRGATDGTEQPPMPPPPRYPLIASLAGSRTSTLVITTIGDVFVVGSGHTMLLGFGRSPVSAFPLRAMTSFLPFTLSMGSCHGIAMGRWRDLRHCMIGSLPNIAPMPLNVAAAAAAPSGGTATNAHRRDASDTPSDMDGMHSLATRELRCASPAKGTSPFTARNPPWDTAETSCLRVADFACGAAFVALAAPGGGAFTVGANDWGQLGIGSGTQWPTGSTSSSSSSGRTAIVTSAVGGASSGPRSRASSFVDSRAAATHVDAATTGLPAHSGSGAIVAHSCTRMSDLNVVHVAAGYAFAFAVVQMPASWRESSGGGATGAPSRPLSGAAAALPGLVVFFWGNNNHGQSGLGRLEGGGSVASGGTPALIDTPTIVPALSTHCGLPGGPGGIAVVQIACGSFFALAVTPTGDVYSWGLAECCGLGSLADLANTSTSLQIDGRLVSSSIGTSATSERKPIVSVPVRIPTLADVVAVAAGQWHAVAITAQGCLFSWGVGSQGRLGHGDVQPRYVPTRVAYFGPRSHSVGPSIFATSTFCGSFNSGAIDHLGAMHVWGDNEAGQCPVESAVYGTMCDGSECVLSPAPIRTPMMPQRSCGGASSLLLPVDVLPGVTSGAFGRQVLWLTTTEGRLWVAGSVSPSSASPTTATSAHDSAAIGQTTFARLLRTPPPASTASADATSAPRLRCVDLSRAVVASGGSAPPDDTTGADGVSDRGAAPPQPWAHAVKCGSQHCVVSLEVNRPALEETAAAIEHFGRARKGRVFYPASTLHQELM